MKHKICGADGARITSNKEQRSSVGVKPRDGAALRVTEQKTTEQRSTERIDVTLGTRQVTKYRSRDRSD